MVDYIRKCIFPIDTWPPIRRVPGWMLRGTHPIHQGLITALVFIPWRREVCVHEDRAWCDRVFIVRPLSRLQFRSGFDGVLANQQRLGRTSIHEFKSKSISSIKILAPGGCSARNAARRRLDMLREGSVPTLQQRRCRNSQHSCG